MTKESVDGPSKSTARPAVRGTGVIFYIKQTGQFMFYLRDDKKSIPFPNMVSLLGGHMETGETAEETAIRELGEELTDKDTGQPFHPDTIAHFRTYTDDRGVEQNIFSCALDNAPNLRLSEGQRLILLRKDELPTTTFAFGFNQVVQDFARSV